MLRILMLVVLSSLTMVAAVATQETPRVRILAPDPDTVVSGETVFVAEVAPVGSAVTEIRFSVDAAEVCVARQSPFRCVADVGASAAQRHVRAVALLDTGARVAGALRTKGIDFAEAVSVAAVAVSAHVTDGRGRFVRGLTQADFRVFEDGVAQEITSFGAIDGAVELVVALDMSGSMAPTFDGLKVTVLQFLGKLRGHDTVTLAGFNTALFVLSPKTADSAARDAALKRIRPFGGTALYDAMIRGSDLLKTPAPRKALVLFTDGDDVSSRGSADLARTTLQGRDVVLYVIGQGRAAEDDKLRERLEELAVETGGAAFFSTKPSQLAEHFAEIVENLTNQYVFSYTPKRAMGDGKWREINVELTGRRHRVRARQGYFAVAGEGKLP